MQYYKQLSTGEVFAYANAQEREQWGAEDLVQMSAAEVQAHINPPLTDAQRQARFTSAVQLRLDEFAQTRGYDNILSACTYATSTVASFASEGQRAVQMRDATWAAAHAVIAAAQAGNRPMPETIEQAADVLPELSWED